MPSVGGLKPTIVVPARLASQRFPRKLLHPVRGRPLVLWTAERLREVAPNWPTWFAVDSEEMASVLERAGHRVVRTDPAHASGTDRIAEANRTIRAAHVINVQADEPRVAREHLEALAAWLEEGSAMATLATPFLRAEDFLNPNQVKVVADSAGRALYFSRAPIPYPREGGPAAVTPAWLQAHGVLRHLGLYAYEAGLLERFVAWPAGRLERIERLEQLRALENGVAIGVGTTATPSVGVDVPEDVAAFEAALGST